MISCDLCNLAYKSYNHIFRMSEADEAKRIKRIERLREYNQRDYVREIARARSIAVSHKKKVLTTKKRFEELSMYDLLYIAQLKCAESGLDFDAKRSEFEAVFRVLHGPEII